MAKMEPKAGTKRRRKMTLDEVKAFNARLLADPKIQQMLREADEQFAAGDYVRWEDLKRQHGWR